MKEQDKIKEYHSLCPGDFRVVSRIGIVQRIFPEVDTPELTLELDLTSETGNDSRRLALSFTGVRNLRLQQPSWSLFQMTTLQIMSIAEDQWEGLKYKVRDDEEDSVSFTCSDFEAHLEDG